MLLTFTITIVKMLKFLKILRIYNKMQPAAFARGMICDNNNKVHDILVTKTTHHVSVIGMQNIKNLNKKYPS